MSKDNQFVREFLNDHVLELATQAATTTMVSGGGVLQYPPRETVVTLVGKYYAHIVEQHVPDAPKLPPPPPPRLDKLELDTGYITFSGGVPVGGYSHLSLFPNGAFSFTGHFHVSGAPSYDTRLIWVLRSNAGTAFTFAHSGRVHGTFESGSRDDDWGDSGTNPAVAAAWGDISAGYSFQWNAAVNADIGKMIDQAVKTIGQIATVIAIVA